MRERLLSLASEDKLANMELSSQLTDFKNEKGKIHIHIYTYIHTELY